VLAGWGFADEGEEFFGGEGHADFSAGHALLKVVERCGFGFEVVGVGHEVEGFFAGGVNKPCETTGREVGAVLVLSVVILDAEFLTGCVDDFLAVIAGAFRDAGAVGERGNGVEQLKSLGLLRSDVGGVPLFDERGVFFLFGVSHLSR